MNTHPLHQHFSSLVMTLAMSVNYSQFALAINIKGLEEKTCTRQTYATFLAENTQRINEAKSIPQTTH